MQRNFPTMALEGSLTQRFSLRMVLTLLDEQRSLKLVKRYGGYNL